MKTSVLVVTFLLSTTSLLAQGNLEQQLLTEDISALAKAARELGDAKRGAIVFHQPYLVCTKCHLSGDDATRLGPDLAKAGKDATDVYIIESILQPSKKIKKGFESVSIITTEGKAIQGIVVKDEKDRLMLKDAANLDKPVILEKSAIDEQTPSNVSLMPKGLTNALTSRQQFLDLARYLMEIADGGPQRALALKPDPALYAARPLPEYEKRIDHAGMIASLDNDCFKRGEAIYNRLCINCHGTKDRPGSLPTSLRFAEGKFKNGSAPYTMYQTLTRGFGMMVPQTWMVPQQKYDVIHYIRQAYLKPHNPSQLFEVTDDYLASLPVGDTRGPEPSNIQPWTQMDYGPNLTHTYEIPGGPLNFAYKGIAVRLDSGPGGVSRGRHWMVFDHDTMRVAAAWSGEGFIDWNGIMFNGRHAIHPKIVGSVQFANPVGPGWANPETGEFEDVRLRGRDDRLYGPLPRKWAHYKGMYIHADRVVVSYSVGDTDVMEMPGLLTVGDATVFTRTFNIGSRARDMVLQVAHHTGSKHQLVEANSAWNATLFGTNLSKPAPQTKAKEPAQNTLAFNGATRVDVKGRDFDMTGSDYTIIARIKTTKSGTVFCKTRAKGRWVPNGKTLFVRGGRLCFDIGWVGVVQTDRRVNDGKWHDVAMTWRHESGEVQLYIDGKREGQGSLKPKGPVKGHVVRMGYTSPNFPRDSGFKGEIEEVWFYSRALSDKELAENAGKGKAVGHWELVGVKGDVVADLAGKHQGKVFVGEAAPTTIQDDRVLVFGVSNTVNDAAWNTDMRGNLRLKIPAGDKPLKFVLWAAAQERANQVTSLIQSVSIKRSELDLAAFTQGGSPRWPAELKTQGVIGKDDGPFAVDTLTRPTNNPWFCRMRFGGFDFYPDGKRMLVCDWDGDVWRVTGVDAPEKGLTWRRIASGLFQPLGLRIMNDKIYVTCRDQLAVLHDLNDDGEIDFYENFNNDHQVTEHFHEFAMGLQTDDEGNFYYAKSARHALKALVPHHGTLLKISKDGTSTEILATGFRAANGVCLNPDGTFIVTDQEGHWNPKNRINWVSRGGFYGNMFGYHDVTDSADSAMDQPLCWITNAFDRSPAELLWVGENAKWGPLNGSLLNLSYGYGQVYVVPHEKIDGQIQGGMCALPIARLPTGVMRGRFHPHDGQLYCCGLFAWAGSQHQPGGFYRVRYTGKPAHLPIGLHATKEGMRITFSGELDAQIAAEANRYAVKTWSLKRTASYGSKHYDEKQLKITSVEFGEDQRSVLLRIPDIEPTWCMEIRYSLKGSGGEKVDGVVHNTVHRLK